MTRRGVSPTGGMVLRSMSAPRSPTATSGATSNTTTDTNTTTGTGTTQTQTGTSQTAVSSVTDTITGTAGTGLPAMTTTSSFVSIPTTTTTTSSTSTGATGTTTTAAIPAMAGATLATDSTNALAGMMQQLLTTVSQIGVRLNNLETARTEATLQQATQPAVPPSIPATATTTATVATVAPVATTGMATTNPVGGLATAPQVVRTTEPAPTVAAASGQPGGTATTGTVTATNSATTAPRRRTTRPAPPGSPDDGYSSSSRDSSGSWSGDGYRRRHHHRRRQGRHDSRERRHRRHEMKKNVKELDLQPFKPQVGGMRVETWIAKVDLAVLGARISGRGDWNEEELYYVVGAKLQDNAAKLWVQCHKELAENDRTWTKLKEALIRRYGERPDLAQAEWRVMQRTMEPGESFADFAAGLRDAAGQNPVREETMLGQFYRGLDKGTRQLVKAPPLPKTLGEAVERAMEVDDPNDNVALGMKNIGQAWAINPAPTSIPMQGTRGAMQAIPGIGSLPSEVVGTATAEGNESGVGRAFFTNPQGIFDKNANVWVAPGDLTWNGRFWRKNKKTREREQRAAVSDQRAAAKRHSGKPERRMKVMMVATDNASDSEYELEEPPPPQRKKSRTAPVHQTKAPATTPAPKSVRTERTDNRRFGDGHRCYACGQHGHFAKECPDPAARARNDAYLAERNANQRAPENGSRA